MWYNTPMKTFIEEYLDKSAAKGLFDIYFGDFSFAVFDIETTGFSGFNDSVILSGSLVSRDGGIKVYQYFAENPKSEKEVIQAIIDLINQVDFIVTYNGRYFDVPFMKKRAAKYGLVFPDKFNLDLFILFKHYSELSNFLPSLSQKSMEEYGEMAHLREDRISGGESVELFEQYQTAYSAELEEKILLHNRDDVKQLFRLLPLLRQTYLHRALTKNGFPIEGGLIKGISYKNQEVVIKGVCYKPSDYIMFPTADSPYSFRMSGSDGLFEIAVPCEKEKQIVYIDAQSILGEKMEKLENHPGFSSGYLIIKNEAEVNYAEINYFSKELVYTVLSKAGISNT